MEDDVEKSTKALHATPQPLRRALEGQRDTRVHFVDHEAMALDDW